MVHCLKERVNEHFRTCAAHTQGTEYLIPCVLAFPVNCTAEVAVVNICHHIRRQWPKMKKSPICGIFSRHNSLCASFLFSTHSPASSRVYVLVLSVSRGVPNPSQVTFTTLTLGVHPMHCCTSAGAGVAANSGSIASPTDSTSTSPPAHTLLQGFRRCFSCTDMSQAQKSSQSLPRSKLTS